MDYYRPNWPFSTTGSSTAGIVLSSSAVWTGWNITVSATSASSGTAVWHAWNGTGNTASIQQQYYSLMGQHSYQPLREQEDLARIRAATAKRAAEYEAERIRIERAKARAEATLHACLSPKQSEELKANGHFHLELVSSNGERKRYRIDRGRHGNVYQVDDSGKQLKRLCVHPIENVPDADTMLAQKLFLEGSEEELLRVANHS